MGMSSFIIDMEEKFFSAVQEVIHECESLNQLFEITDSQRDLVSHMKSDDVDEIIAEIWLEGVYT